MRPSIVAGPARPTRHVHLVWPVIAPLIATSACLGAGRPLEPSPIIMPDAITLRAGDTQVFVVEHAVVRQFSLSGERREWAACARLDDADLAANSVRFIAQRPCDGLVFLSADIGAGRSELIAAIAVQ